MQRLECGALFEGCDGVVEAATTEEVLAGAAEHARQVHGLTTLDDDTVHAVTQAIVTV